MAKTHSVSPNNTVRQNQMDEARIKELIEELDRAIPESDAQVSFRQYGGGPDECKIVGSQAGLMRAGIELLRTSVRPPKEEKGTRDLSAFRAVIHTESEFFFDYFEEKPLPEDRAAEEENAKTAKVIGIGVLAVVVLTLLFAFYGCVRLFS